MDSVPKRPWYRLHWVTWVVMALVVGSLMYCEFEEHVGIGTMGGGTYTRTSFFGWPRAHVEVVESGSFIGAGSRPFGFKYDWRWSVLGLNLVVCIAIAGSTIWAFESWLRSPNRLQFKLRALLIFTAVIAILLWLLDSEWSSRSRALVWIHSPLVSWTDLQRPVRWPVWLGIACMIYSSGWLALALLRRAYRLVRP